MSSSLRTLLWEHVLQVWPRISLEILQTAPNDWSLAQALATRWMKHRLGETSDLLAALPNSAFGVHLWVALCQVDPKENMDWQNAPTGFVPTPLLAAILQDPLALGSLLARDARDLDRAQQACEDRLPLSKPVRSLGEMAVLFHLLARVYGDYLTGTEPIRLQLTPLLVVLLRRFWDPGVYGWRQLFFQSLVVAEANSAYQAVIALAQESVPDGQELRDRLFRSLQRGVEPSREALSRLVGAVAAQLTVIGLKANQPSPAAPRLLYAQVLVRSPEQGVAYLALRDPAQDPPYYRAMPLLRQISTHWRDPLKLPKRPTQQHKDHHQQVEAYDRALALQAQFLPPVALDRLQRWRAFEMVCWPLGDVLFAALLYAAYTVAAQPATEQQVFWSAGWDAPRYGPDLGGQKGLALQSWSQWLETCGLMTDSPHWHALWDGLLRLASPQRCGEEIYASALSLWAQSLVADGHQFAAQLPDRLRALVLPDWQTLESYFALPFVAAELLLLPRQQAQSVYFSHPLSHELHEASVTPVPAALLYGTVLLPHDDSWPFVAPRFRALLTTAAEINRAFSEPFFVYHRNLMQQRQAEVELEKALLALERANVAHLQGVDQELQRLFEGVQTLRGHSLRVQNRMYPGSQGIWMLREELEWLFAPEQTYYVRFLYPTPAGDPRELAAAHFGQPKEKLPGQQLTLSLHPPSTAQANYTIKTFHNAASADFARRWHDYVPLLYCQAQALELPLILALLKLSRWQSNDHWYRNPDTQEHERRLFIALKTLIHRPYNPMRVGGRSCLHLLHLLGCVLDAGSQGQARSVDLCYTDRQGDTYKLTEVADWWPLMGDLNDAQPNTDLAQKKAVLLRSDILPYRLLAPLQRLISTELLSREAGQLQLQAVKVCETQTAMTVQLRCRNHLPDGQLRSGEEGKHSGLSGALHALAEVLGVPFPTLSDSPPAGNLWIVRTSETRTRSRGAHKVTDTLRFTDLGFSLTYQPEAQ
jgi:hypothetical protein